ncbi:hypothetical protein DUNSADRAFT_3211 [Dunaliella salina]|nr:hypothetical protein DUNSADRAFT_3211 [Dunaliella salina]|eukprot:KAF5838232.1 hypothetical protein DUNSADRAFT_3211 [Dunaliella salina]
MQHNESSKETTVCAHSHVFVGSVEQLIAKSLVNVIESAAALAAQGKHDMAGDCDGEEDGVEDEEARELQQRMVLINQHVSMAEIEQLQTGGLKLPLSERMHLPQPVPCRGACGVVYCSTATEEAAWQQQHCLLCPGTFPGDAHSYAPWTIRRARLGAFYNHAARSNDIFVLVAKAVAMTALRAMHILNGREPMLLQQQQQQQQSGVGREPQQAESFAVSGSESAAGSVSAGYVEWGLRQLKGSLQDNQGSSTSAAPPSASSTAACTPVCTPGEHCSKYTS